MDDYGNSILTKCEALVVIPRVKDSELHDLRNQAGFARVMHIDQPGETVTILGWEKRRAFTEAKKMDSYKRLITRFGDNVRELTSAAS